MMFLTVRKDKSFQWPPEPAQFTGHIYRHRVKQYIIIKPDLRMTRASRERTHTGGG